MSYLFDTDVVADYLQGKPYAEALLPSLLPNPLAISIVTFGEIYEGIYFGNDPERAEHQFLGMLNYFDVISLGTGVMRIYARIRGDLRRSGRLIGDPDLMIAATALYHDLTLVTRNRGHFARVPGLKLLTPA